MVAWIAGEVYLLYQVFDKGEYLQILPSGISILEFIYLIIYCSLWTDCIGDG